MINITFFSNEIVFLIKTTLFNNEIQYQLHDWVELLHRKFALSQEMNYAGNDNREKCYNLLGHSDLKLIIPFGNSMAWQERHRG